VIGVVEKKDNDSNEEVDSAVVSVPWNCLNNEREHGEWTGE